MTNEISIKNTDIKVFTTNIEQEATNQLTDIKNHPVFKNEKIRIMPDVHAGSGCVIGFTSTSSDKIIPNLIGVDIGCGMLCANIGKVEIDLPNLDEFINNNIPHGFQNNDVVNIKSSYLNFEDYVKSICEKIGDLDNYERHLKSVGSLGGGNHFIEVNIDKDGNKYIVIHSGSRNFGHKIASYYQKQADNYCKGKKRQISGLINQHKGVYKVEEDSFTIEYKKELDLYDVSKDLAYLEGDIAQQYLKDMKLAQVFASVNRAMILDKIIEFLGISAYSKFETIHNYIDDNNLIRKGAVSAKDGEILLIPINMRDGSILAKGKGNSDWNNSAPHGAGRLMSRAKATKTIDLQEFSDSMDGVYTTSVNKSTLDEAPMAYKPMQEILKNIKDTVEIIDILKPIYNFKSH